MVIHLILCIYFLIHQCSFTQILFSYMCKWVYIIFSNMLNNKVTYIISSRQYLIFFTCISINYFNVEPWLLKTIKIYGYQNLAFQCLRLEHLNSINLIRMVNVCHQILLGWYNVLHFIDYILAQFMILYLITINY